MVSGFSFEQLQLIQEFYNTKVNNEHFTAVNMASHFSGVLQLTDLDDFITPSQVVRLLLRITTSYLFHGDVVLTNDCYSRTTVNENAYVNI